MKNLRLVPDIQQQQPIVKATHLLKQGTDIKYIQEILGHSSSKITEIYTQVSTLKIWEIKNPLEVFYTKRSGTIHTKKEHIEPAKQRHKRNKHHKDLHSK